MPIKLSGARAGRLGWYAGREAFRIAAGRGGQCAGKAGNVKPEGGLSQRATVAGLRATVITTPPTRLDLH